MTIISDRDLIILKAYVTIDRISIIGIFCQLRQCNMRSANQTFAKFLEKRSIDSEFLFIHPEISS